MRLTTFTDYCLRVLMYAGAKGDELSTIDEICESYDISRGHIMKAVYRLGQLGYLETVRGKGGGMRLALAPEKIKLGSVVRDTEEDLYLVGCFEPQTDACRIQSICILKGALNKALSAFLEVLDSYTLADLIAPQRKLAQLLNLK